MKKKELTPDEVLKALDDLKTAEYKAVLKEAANKGAKMALEIVNKG